MYHGQCTSAAVCIVSLYKFCFDRDIYIKQKQFSRFCHHRRCRHLKQARIPRASPARLTGAEILFPCVLRFLSLISAKHLVEKKEKRGLTIMISALLLRPRV